MGEFVGGILKRIDEYSINMSTEEAIVSDEGVETIDETTSNEKSEDEVDNGEIEVTQNKVHEENEDDEVKKEGVEEAEVDEGEEGHDDEREPSPVMTRRSNRRQVQKKDDPLEADDDTNVAEMITEDVKEEQKEENNQDVIETMDQDEEVESVTSELDSIASGSTLTTRSRRRGGPGPNSTTATKSKKGGGRV